MTNYKIIGLQNNNITLEYDGIKRNFPLPIVDGKYPEGVELSSLLQSYVDHQRANTLVPVIASNENAIKSLIAEQTVDESVVKIKQQRNTLLQLTDWTQIIDNQLTPELKTSWSVYRNELRSITLQNTYPTSVIWPKPPTQIKNIRGIIVVDIDGVPNLPMLR